MCRMQMKLDSGKIWQLSSRGTPYYAEGMWYSINMGYPVFLQEKCMCRIRSDPARIRFLVTCVDGPVGARMQQAEHASCPDPLGVQRTRRKETVTID